MPICFNLYPLAGKLKRLGSFGILAREALARQLRMTRQGISKLEKSDSIDDEKLEE